MEACKTPSLMVHLFRNSGRSKYPDWPNAYNISGEVQRVYEQSRKSSRCLIWRPACHSKGRVNAIDERENEHLLGSRLDSVRDLRFEDKSSETVEGVCQSPGAHGAHVRPFEAGRDHPAAYRRLHGPPQL